MAADPEYVAMMAERKAEYERTRTAKRKAEHDALVERAKTDPEAARQLAKHRKYQSEAAVRSYQKMKAAAEAGGPGGHQTVRSPPCQAQGGLSQKERKAGGDFSMNLEPKIHDNRNGLDYVLTDNYYLPALRLPEDNRPIGPLGPIT